MLLLGILSMKHIKFLLSVIGFALLFCGCSQDNRLQEWMQKNGKLKIISATAQIGDLVQEIGGERIDGWILIQGELDPHSYELVKGDGEKLDRADLIFFNGLGLEHGASLSSWLWSSPKAIPIGERIRELSPERILYRGKTVDPHLWMDISLWAKGIDPIVEELSIKDPAGEAYYKERGEALKEKMKNAHEKLIQR